MKIESLESASQYKVSVHVEKECFIEVAFLVLLRASVNEIIREMLGFTVSLLLLSLLVDVKKICRYYI